VGGIDLCITTKPTFADFLNGRRRQAHHALGERSSALLHRNFKPGAFSLDSREAAVKRADYLRP